MTLSNQRKKKESELLSTSLSDSLEDTLQLIRDATMLSNKQETKHATREMCWVRVSPGVPPSSHKPPRPLGSTMVMGDQTSVCHQISVRKTRYGVLWYREALDIHTHGTDLIVNTFIEPRVLRSCNARHTISVTGGLKV